MLEGFQPRYIQETELKKFGLPTPSEQTNIMTLVEQASTLIDEHCGRTELDGKGSLLYSTYTERLHFTTGRNILRLSYTPLVAIPASVTSALSASGGSYYTGFEANTISKTDGTLSPIISARGRYGYGRRADSAKGQDANYGMNILQVMSYFGGPPSWVDIDITGIDFDIRTGEVWVPIGLYLSNYTEMEVKYNSGYDPRNLPPAIKHATANLCKNFLAKVATGIKSITGAGKVGLLMTDDLLDDTIRRLLQNYVVSIVI